MELKGVIEDFIYQNEINSYTIAELNTGDELYTVVGYLPFVNEGDTLKLQGKFVTHQEYGEQFKIDTFEKLMPETLEGLEKYLASGAIKGLGPATARKIIDKFGEDTLNIFKFEPSKLAEIKGISANKAIEMGEEFNEKWELWQIVSFLEKFGISASNSKKVYEALGNDAIEKIQENPYILVDVTYGVDFNKIDKIALELGIPYDSDSRVRSGVKYAILLASYNGNTCVEKNNLIEFVTKKLEVDKEIVEDNIINLTVNNDVYVENRGDEEWIYLYPFFRAESNIAERLKALDRYKNLKYINNFEMEIKKQEKLLDIYLSDKQKEAVNQINEHNVCIITGGPGTGKTTIIKTVLEIYKSHGKKVVLCAPTGRAAKRITETTGEEAKTIHRLLEIGKIDDDKLSNIDSDIVPIDGDVIIIDEASMVDVFLMNYITKAIFLGSKLVIVGDSNQLPSVGPGNILKDLIDSEVFATVTLNKIFRQAARSKIIVNAHNVNRGVSFISHKELDEELIDEDTENKENETKNNSDDKLEEMNDFFYINESNQEKMLAQIISLCKERLKNYGNYDFFKNIQVLTPTKKGMIGTKELNGYLQNALNPEKKNVAQKQYGSICFREGDRVMQIKNNYDMFWEKTDGTYENGTGVFNGELGRITKIDNEEKSIKVTFDDKKEAFYTYSELEQLEHAYAITIHKAQRKRV